jgi:hypothetical protein
MNHKLIKELNAINILIENIAEKHNLSFQSLINLLDKTREKKETNLIPSFVLRERELGILESTVKYLKEELNLSYHKIALLLNRDDRVIWVTYNKAIKKKKERFVVREPNKWIPTSIFTNKDLGLLEVITTYLKDELNLCYHEIATLLNRDNRTIWTSYNKAKDKLKKRGNEKE